MSRNNTWVCIACGYVLGLLIGQELNPADKVKLRTQGANLVLTCPECGATKVWYPADPMLRVMKQFVDVIATETARAAMRAVGVERSRLRQEERNTIGEGNGN